MLLLVLSLLDLPPLFKFPFFFTYECRQHMTLTKSEVQVRQWSVGIFVPEVDEIEDLLRIQHERHRSAFGSSGPFLFVPDDFSKFFIISFIFIRRNMERHLLLMRTWPHPTCSSCFDLQ